MDRRKKLGIPQMDLQIKVWRDGIVKASGIKKQ